MASLLTISLILAVIAAMLVGFSVLVCLSACRVSGQCSREEEAA